MDEKVATEGVVVSGGSRMLSPAKSNRKPMLIFIAIVVIVGVYLLVRSFAAQPLVASLQAEQMTLPTGASSVKDSKASAGEAVKMKYNGSLKGSVTIPSNSTVNSATVAVP